LGLAGFAAVVVVVVAEGVVVVALVLEDGDETETPPVSFPALVTANVTARINTPKAAMIAGRGSSIRGALDTVGIERR
jgi:hypothetical protein